MNINEMGDWRFLTPADCDPPITLIISGLIEKDCARNGAEPDVQWCLTFEADKRVVPLRKTVRSRVAKLLKSPETDNWIAATLEWYVEQITVRGETKGAVRPRLPKPEVPF